MVGYPENGPLLRTPGRIRDVQPLSAVTSMATVDVLRRDSLDARGGSPRKLWRPRRRQAWQVVGVVFASSLDSDNTGYAMTAEQVAPAVTEGVAAVDSSVRHRRLHRSVPSRRCVLTAYRSGSGSRSQLSSSRSKRSGSSSCGKWPTPSSSRQR